MVNITLSSKQVIGKLQTYQLEDTDNYYLDQHQILVTDLQGNKQLLEGRFNHQILAIEGLI